MRIEQFIYKLECAIRDAMLPMYGTEDIAAYLCKYYSEERETLLFAYKNKSNLMSDDLLLAVGMFLRQ